MSNEHAARGAKGEFEWKGTEALKRVHALNERCLEVLAHLAHTARDRVTVDIINRHRAPWRGLDAAARKRAAQAPFLLVDVHFQSDDWWHWAKNPRSTQRRTAVSPSSFPPKSADELMRETLMLAWSVVSIDRGAGPCCRRRAPITRTPCTNSISTASNSSAANSFHCWGERARRECADHAPTTVSGRSSSARERTCGQHRRSIAVEESPNRASCRRGARLPVSCGRPVL
jgi:hypothetical protein